MCSGGGGGTRVVETKVDPAPTVVSPQEVQSADSGTQERKERRKATRSRNTYAEDRGTILGTLSGNNGNANDTSGTRNKLG